MDSLNLFSQAIKLAESVKGSTSPNPAVGCVIEKDGVIVGKGATRKAGQDHAEIVALKEAGEKAKDATLYVTLEPCVSYPGKKTQSCAAAIIKAGVKKVIIGMKDPNPSINGKGIKELENAGISVRISHEHRREIRVLNEDFFKFIQTGLPFVCAKAALTLDGNIATKTGDSKWISSVESRTLVHKMRNRVDAILVGVGTVLNDNPELTVRLVEKIKNPLRIVVDPNGRTPETSHVMQGEEPTLFIVSPGAPSSFNKMCDKYKKQWTVLDKGKDNHISMKEVISVLAKIGIESIIIEGGSKIFASAFREHIIDKLILFFAPKILGGAGIPLIGGEPPIKMAEAAKMKDISVENIGEDILIQGYF